MARDTTTINNKILSATEKLNISDYTTDIQDVLDYINNSDVQTGRSKEHLICTSILVVCRKNNLPKDSTDISELYDKCTKNEIIETYKNIKSQLDNINYTPTGWKPYIRHLCNTYDINIEDKCIRLGEYCAENGLYSGRNPRSYAGGIFYATIKMENNHVYITQSDVAVNSNCSTSTVRSIYKSAIEQYDTYMTPD